MKIVNRRDEILAMVDDVEERESRLTEWEADFIASIRSQLDEGRSLSSKQTETLNKIWDRCTERG